LVIGKSILLEEDVVMPKFQQVANQFLVLLLSSGLITVSVFGSAQALEGKDQTKATAAKPAAAGVARGIHRLDFQLSGVSCATCILKIRAALRATKGVNRVEIALRKPYGGVLLFEPGVITPDKLVVVAEKADKNGQARVKDLVEEPISSIPVVLIPKYNALQKAKSDGPPESPLH
jgi:copper chaperone CopZ